MGIKDNQLSYKCEKCNKKWLKPVNESFIPDVSIYLIINFATMIVITLFFLLRKGVYPYEDMDSWEKFDETSFKSSNTTQRSFLQQIKFRRYYR